MEVIFTSFTAFLQATIQMYVYCLLTIQLILHAIDRRYIIERFIYGIGKAKIVNDGYNHCLDRKLTSGKEFWVKVEPTVSGLLINR